MAKLGRRGFTRSSLTDQKAHCVEAARSCQMLSRVITKQHHETVLIQCLNAMVGITRSKVFFLVVFVAFVVHGPPFVFVAIVVCAASAVLHVVVVAELGINQAEQQGSK